MSDPESDGPAEPEESVARLEVRLPADMAVRVVWVDMTQACGGRLRDVSETGARVAINGAAGETRDIYLLAHLPGEAEPRRIGAVMRWQVGETIGVRFDPPLTAELVEALAR
ncbi:MAG: PilZ domain-containing protein [Hyphomonas sp.]